MKERKRRKHVAGRKAFGAARKKASPASLDQGRIQFESRNSWEPVERTLGEGHGGKGPRDYVRSDDSIWHEICERFTDDPELDPTELEVTVEEGLVSLRGKVASRSMKWRAEDDAEMVSGVNRVNNELTVEEGDRGASMGF